MKAYLQDTSIRKKITRGLQSNSRLTAFVICVFIATVCWFFTALNKPYSGHFTFNLTYRNLPFHKNMTGEMPRKLEVELEARGFDLIAYSFRQKLDVLDVDVQALTSAQRPGNSPVMIPARSILAGEVTGLQPELTIKHITPEFIVFDFSPKFRKKVPVRADVTIACKEQFFAPYGYIVKPDSVEIAGSAQSLSGITQVVTEPMRLTGLNRKTILSVGFKLKDVKGVEVNPDKAWVYVPVEELAEGEIQVPVEMIGGNTEGLLLLPDKVKVTYQASLNRIEEINTEEFRVCTRIYEDAITGRHSRLELCHIPAGVFKARVDPSFIQILSAR